MAKTSDEAVFVCAESEVLDDEGEALTLRDSAGVEVPVFSDGTAAD